MVSAVNLILLLTAATYSQPFTAFNFAIDNDQKALFPTAKGRFRLYISATYHPNVFVSVSFGYWHLSVFYLYVVVFFFYCKPEEGWLSVKIPVNGYGHSEEIPVIVHNNPFTFLYKEEENRAGHLLARRKVGVSIAN